MNKITPRSFLKRVSLELTAFVPAARSLAMLALPTKQGGSGWQVGNITSLPSVTLAGLALGADQQTVTAQLGQAATIEQAHGSGMIEWHYSDISIRFGCIDCSDPRIKQIIVRSSSVGSTAAGIHVGSSTVEIKQAFGTALIDHGVGGFAVAVGPGQELQFVHTNGTVTLLVLRDVTCSSCTPATGPQGGGKEL